MNPKMNFVNGGKIKMLIEVNCADLSFTDLKVKVRGFCGDNIESLSYISASVIGAFAKGVKQLSGDVSGEVLGYLIAGYWQDVIMMGYFNVIGGILDCLNADQRAAFLKSFNSEMTQYFECCSGKHTSNSDTIQ